MPLVESMIKRMPVHFLRRRIKLDVRFPESSILNQNEGRLLNGYAAVSTTQRWKLIFRASRDGFAAAKFHQFCDNQPNNYIVIKSTNGNVFGGFTPLNWNGNGVWKVDGNSFIFSLRNGDNTPMKILNHTGQYSIGCHSSYGPRFGGADLYISDNSNANQSSYSNLGHSYKHPTYAYESNESKNFLAGSFNFKVSEIEVFIKQ